MANRAARMTKGQKETLVHYLEEHNIMLAPKLSVGDELQVKNHWETVSNLLNSQLGAKKSVKQWKEAWNELKTNVRRKARENTYDIKGTGGGVKKTKELSEMEDRILGLISKIVIQGAPLPEAGILEGENFEEVSNEHSEELLGQYIVLPIASHAQVSTNPNPILEREIQVSPQAEAEVLTTPRPRAKKIIQKKRNIKIHPMQQVVNAHEKCLHNVASSSNKIADALLVLSTSITRVGRKNNSSAVFQLKF